MTSRPASPETKASTSAVLMHLAQAEGEERISVGEIVSRLGDRAPGLLLVMLALPMCIPNVPGISTIFGLLMLAPAMQLVLAREQLWLPNRVRAWTVSRAALSNALRRAAPTLRKIERFVGARWTMFVLPPAEQLLGLQTLLMALVLMLPIPGGNWPPGITVAATGLALAQRDGRLALLTVPMAAVSIAIAWVGFRIGAAVVIHGFHALARLFGG
ncbi:MAG: exopolysaccharide biosynthesis protein [Proteobacteria bacterium]|nr:exopolysaccharide biosynthesis protein [Pseudomonadota bacterium]